LHRSSPSASEPALESQLCCQNPSGLSTSCPPEQETTPLRTIRSWIALYRKGQQLYGNGYVGLLPEIRNGNRTVRITEEVQDLVQAGVKNYETHKQITKAVAYGGIVSACEAKGYDAPSYQYFADLLNQRPKHEQTLKRKGPRAAYPYEPFYLTLDQKTPPHGDFPMQIGHIDHTQLDIELFTSTGKSLGRPWATFLTDAFSRRILAIYLTFDPPSYRSCMMVLRECVRRYKRFPQIIVVDGGKEFKGIYFEALLVYCESTKKTRPRAKSRFGSVCERLFGTSSTQLVHNMLGNTQIMKNVRQVTQSVNPKKEGAWTLGEFYPVLCEWGYNFYDTTEHPALGMTPREAFAQGQAQSGQRKHRWVDYNDDFIKLTMPTTRKGTAKVQIGAGVKINYLYYSSPSFRPIELKIQAASALPQGAKKRKKVEETEVEVRYDPYDLGVAYALVDGQWIKCYSQYYTTFHGRSEREIKLASTLFRRQKQRHAQSFTINAKRLAEFLAKAEVKAALVLQRLHDREARDVFAQMGARLEMPDEGAQDAVDTPVEAGVTETQVSLPVLQPAGIDEDDEVDLDDLPDFERL
jgi:putative transposase